MSLQERSNKFHLKNNTITCQKLKLKPSTIILEDTWLSMTTDAFLNKLGYFPYNYHL